MDKTRTLTAAAGVAAVIGCGLAVPIVVAALPDLIDGLPHVVRGLPVLPWRLLLATLRGHGRRWMRGDTARAVPPACA